MNGYILIAIDDKTGETVGYYNGTTFEEEIGGAQFLANATDGRQTLGRLQQRMVDQELRIVPAHLQITPGHIAAQQGQPEEAAT